MALKNNSMDRCLQCDGQQYYRADYDYYKNTLKFNIEFSTKTKNGKLGYCKSCKTWWYLDYTESNIYPVYDWQMNYLTKWNSKCLNVNRKILEILEKIKATPIDKAGNNKEFIDFPCKVKINGILHDFVILSFQKIPPLGERFCEPKNIYFLDEIQDILPSDYMLNDSIRYASANAQEVRMGFSPTIIKDFSNNLYYINWSQCFFETNGLMGKDMILADSFDFNKDSISPSEDIFSKITYVIGDWNDELIRLRINAN